MYSELPGFPTHTDLEFILLDTLEDKGLLGKDFTAEQVWDGFSHSLGTIADLRGFLDTIFSGDNIIPLIGGQRSSGNSYVINSHPWMN